MSSRNHHAGSVRASVLSPIVSLLDERSAKTDFILAGQELTRAQLNDSYARVPLRRYVALFEEAACLLDDPYLGLHLGARTRPADLGPLGLLFTASPTIKAGLIAFSRSLAALQSGTLIRLDECGEFGHFAYQIEDASIWPRVQDSDFTLSVTTELCRTLTGENWSPAEVHFDHPRPPDLSLYRKMFRCPLVFDAPQARLTVTRRDLNQACQASDEGLIAVLNRHAADVALQNETGATLLGRVRAHIRSRLAFERVTVDRTAKDLGLSTRSLQRDLQREGTSFRDVVQDERCTFALRRLASRDRTESIAASMGYADSTVFWRAFKRWTGEPPSRYRGDNS